MRCALSLLFLLTVSWSASANPSEETYRSMVEAAIEESIGPSARAFSEAGARQESEVAAFCRAPSTETLQSARAAFAETALAWSRLEYINIGPWLEEDRGPRVYFFPDRRGVVGRHTRRALQKADPDLLSDGGIAVQSAAIQGLPALEYLLYGSGYEMMLEEENAGFRCALASAVAANIARIAEGFQAAWRSDAPFARALIDPASDGRWARSPEEAAALFFGRVPVGLEALEERKLRAPLSSGLDKAKPHRAPYVLSGLTNRVLQANLLGLLDLMQSAIDRGELSPAVLAAAQKARSEALAALDALDRPFGEAAADPGGRAAAEDLLAALVAMRQEAAEAPLEALGLRVYLKSDDGD